MKMASENGKVLVSPVYSSFALLLFSIPFHVRIYFTRQKHTAERGKTKHAIESETIVSEGEKVSKCKKWE